MDSSTHSVRLSVASSKAEPASFFLEDFPHPVPVQLTENITKEQLLGFLPFNKWLSALKTSLDRQGEEQHPFHTSPFSLRSVTIQSVDFFKPTVIGFIKLNAGVENANGKTLPGIAFLRGPSVAVLMILQPSDSKAEKWVILTEQPRVAAGSLQFMEVPAGMIDPETESFAGTAANVIMKKTGFKFPEQKLKDLTKYAIGKEAIWDDDTWDDRAPAGSSDDLGAYLRPVESCLFLKVSVSLVYSLFISTRRYLLF